MNRDPISTRDFILTLFVLVDDQIPDYHKHPQAKLYPSEVVTLALLYALTGKGQLAFWRWLTRDYRDLFPNLPDRTRLFRLFNSHRKWIDRFLAEPTLLGIIDSYGIELIHPRRARRTDGQLGRSGKSNHRWIVGGKLCFILNQLGLIVDWAVDTANVYDGSAFQELVDQFEEQTIIFADTGFNKKDWTPDNLKICQRGQANFRMLIETVLSMLTNLCDFKHLRHRAWEYFETKVGFTMALFNILAQGSGLQPDEQGFIPLSIAEFSL